MRKLFLPIFLLMFGLLALKAQDSAVPPAIAGEAVYIPFPVAITVDGQLEDWAGLEQITVTEGPYTSNNPAENGSLSFSAAADAENFYIVVTMVDATIITGQHETNYWNEDSIEFYLNLSDERYLSAYTDGIFQFNINPGDIGNTDPSAITLTGVNSASVALEAFVFATEDGWGFEAQVPLGDFVVEHGREIGLQVQANGASELDRNVKLIWSSADTGDQSWNNPALFGSGIFFELGSTDIPSPSERPAELVAPEPEPMVARISMNQVGYYPDSPKYAMISAEQARLNALWVVYNEAGERVALGMSEPATLDEASGYFVQVADFSEVTTPGVYTLEFGGILSQPFVIGTDFYDELSRDALR